MGLNFKSHVTYDTPAPFCVQGKQKLASFNSLWSSDAIGHRRSWSTLVLVMACCLMVPSHYLNSCWFIIKSSGIHSSVMFTSILKIWTPKLCLKLTHMKSQPHLHREKLKSITCLVTPWARVSTFMMLTLKVQGLSYLGLTKSISWLLMPWLLASPGHQQPW